MPLPARFQAHVHVPSENPNIHVNASMENWTITGCVSDAPKACDKTTTSSVPMEARIEFLRLWEEARTMPRCEPEAEFPDDRAFELTYSTGSASGRLPAREADLTRRNEGPCRAYARIAMWFAQQLRARV